MKLTICGGLYVERCIQPLWNSVFGSGGRAAAAASKLVPNIILATYVADALINDAKALAGQFGFQLKPTHAKDSVTFDYLHPLATPRITPHPNYITPNDPIQVEGDVVLRFGMLEGDAIVKSNVAIYDPQSAFGAKRFSSNGSTTKRLAIVLNGAEAASMTGIDDPLKAAKWLLKNDMAEVVIVKMGSHGAQVVTPEKSKYIPLYKSMRVWKIGSGDVFSSSFAVFWGVQGIDPFTAADLASRATALYCNSQSLPVEGKSVLEKEALEPITPGQGMIYLAGPFFDLGQRWLVEETRSLFLNLGARVFSPVHEVGPGPGEIVAPEDIKGLENSDVVFAILNGLDTGTIFEVGYAVKKGIPIVALAQNIKDEDLKMIIGTGGEVIDDLASAIYRSIWKLPTS